MHPSVAVPVREHPACDDSCDALTVALSSSRANTPHYTNSLLECCSANLTYVSSRIVTFKSWAERISCPGKPRAPPPSRTGSARMIHKPHPIPTRCIVSHRNPEPESRRDSRSLYIRRRAIPRDDQAVGIHPGGVQYKLNN